MSRGGQGTRSFFGVQERNRAALHDHDAHTEVLANGLTLAGRRGRDTDAVLALAFPPYRCSTGEETPCCAG